MLLNLSLFELVVRFNLWSRTENLSLFELVVRFNLWSRTETWSRIVEEEVLLVMGLKSRERRWHCRSEGMYLP